MSTSVRSNEPAVGEVSLSQAMSAYWSRRCAVVRRHALGHGSACRVVRSRVSGERCDHLPIDLARTDLGKSRVRDPFLREICDRFANPLLDLGEPARKGRDHAKL